MQLVYVERVTKGQKLFVLLRAGFILFLVIKLNSLASIMAFLAACLCACVLFRKLNFIILAFLILTPIGIALYGSLLAGDIRIARKDISTIQDGTGRFETWKECSLIIAKGEVPFFGVGLMNERTVLKSLDVEVTHTCHSSPLTNIFSFGIIGAILYLVFSLICLRELASCAKINRTVNLYIQFLLWDRMCSD